MEGNRVMPYACYRPNGIPRRAALRQLGFGGLAAAGMVVGSARAPVAAQETTPAAIPPLLEEWAAAWSAEDLDRLLALYTDDAVFEDVAAGVIVRGKREIGAVFATSLEAFSGIQQTLLAGFLAGDRATAEAQFAGEQTGDLPGSAASGRAVSYRFAAVFELAGERFRRESDYLDLYGLLVQLGALPSPGSTGG